MTLVLRELVLDAHDVARVADFWQQALGWLPTGRWADDGEIELADPAGSWPALLVVPVPEPKRVKNRLHLDVCPAAGSDQDTELDRLLALGATRVDVGQGAPTWIVLADPEGNEFCLLRDPDG